MKYILFALMVVISTASQAVEIQKVSTKVGDVWLVESHSLPMVSAKVTFRAGSVFDAKGQEGLAAFATNLMTEATTSLNKTDFARALESKGIQIYGGASELNSTFSVKTLSDYKTEAFKYLADTIKTPALAAEDAGRIKSALIANLTQSEEDASYLSSRAYKLQLYGRHAYGQPTSGYLRTVKNFSPEMVKAYQQKMLGYENMNIAIVGDITAKEVKELINTNFADMHKGEAFDVRVKPKERFPTFTRISRLIPQAHIIMGHLGLSRDNPDYFSAYVMNYILGGGSFASRLMQKVRVENGLAYSVYSYFDPMPFAGSFTVGLQTKNKSAHKAMRLVKEQMRELMDKGVKQKEYENAINFLTGSFPMRLDTSDKLLGYLSMMQTENVSADYLDTWIAKIKAVSLIDVNAAAQKYLKPEDMTIVQVGGDQ